MSNDNAGEAHTGTAELERAARDVGDEWKNHRYYEKAEMWLGRFWNPNREFMPMFERLDLSSVVELACGHGRHATKVREFSPEGRILLMDINEENLEFVRKRFEDDPNAHVLKTEGFLFDGVDDESQSAILCYDAMVHFDSEVVFSYLRDTRRVLRPGGMALYHHSNYMRNPGGHHHDNPMWRNFMSQSLFAHYAAKAGLKVIDSRVFSWGPHIRVRYLISLGTHRTLRTDCLTLVQKV